MGIFDRIRASINSPLGNNGSGGGGTTSPLTTKGDIWGYSTTNTRVPVGTDGQALLADSTQALGVRWGSVSASPASTNGAVQFNNSGVFGGDATNLFWNSSSHFLGIGTSNPQESLHTVGSVTVQGNATTNKASAFDMDWISSPVAGGRFISRGPNSSTRAAISFIITTSVSSNSLTPLIINADGTVTFGSGAVTFGGQINNTAGNILGSDGVGLSGNSIAWATGSPGYATAYFNSDTSNQGNGLAVKVAGTAGVALDVSQGSSQGTAGSTLFRVNANGKIVAGAQPSLGSPPFFGVWAPLGQTSFTLGSAAGGANGAIQIQSQPAAVSELHGIHSDFSAYGDLHIQPAGGTLKLGNATLLWPNSDGTNKGDLLQTDAAKNLTLGGLFINAPQGSADPAGPVKGSVYFNTTANKLKVFNGTSWETVTSA